MRKLQIVITVLAVTVGVLGMIMATTAAPWFGALMVVVGAIALVLTFWPDRGNEKEGYMVGFIEYAIVDGQIHLSVNLEDLAEDAEMTENVIRDRNESESDEGGVKYYYFSDIYPEEDGHCFLKRFVMVKVDAFGNLAGLNVLLNGMSYEADLMIDGARNVEVYLEDAFMMRLSMSNFALLAGGFGADNLKLGWHKLDDDMSDWAEKA